MSDITYKRAMDDLHAKRITPDQFRAIVRAMRASQGAAATEMAKIRAIVASNR